MRLFHNPSCSTSRHALAEVKAAGAELEVVQYLKTPLDRAVFLALLVHLEDPPGDLVRQDDFFRSQGLRAADYVTPEAVADLLMQYPRLMQRPVLERNGRAIIGRPKGRIAAFLA